MKRNLNVIIFISFLVISFFPVLASYGQTLTQNYVLTNAPRISGIVNDSTLNAVINDKTKIQSTIQYMDGLGRPIQTIQRAASPLGYDVIQPQFYDKYGREVLKFLPYTPQSGAALSYRTSVRAADSTFYQAPPSNSAVGVIVNPYAQTAFDNSPISRPVEQGGPGTPWQLTGVTGGGHTVKISYASNNSTTFAADSVNSRILRLYQAAINSNQSHTISVNGTYAAGTIIVTISKDENWVSGRAGTVEEYKDIDGKVLLKRQYNYQGGLLQLLSTFYVYDDMDRLAFVLPPGFNPDNASTFPQSALDNLCYQYQYDGLGRMTQKKLPGKGWEYMVYNNMDQLIATQDSLQRAAKQWIYTKYDGQQRAIMTGIWTNGGVAISRASLQSSITALTGNYYETNITTGTGYSNVAWPTSNTTSLTLNYFDDYDNAIGLPSQFTAPVAGSDAVTRGELVATKTAVLNTPANMLWSAMYYDYWGRSILSYKQHYLGGTLSSNNFDSDSTTYNFTNAPTTVTRKHWNTASTAYPLLTITNTYLYDHVGRKRNSWIQIKNGNTAAGPKTLLSRIDYNEIGQVKAKNLHSTDSVNYLQTIDYTYNERGWMILDTSALFAMKLYYNNGTPHKEYNGNIAYQQWGTPTNIATYQYNYTYDKLNRLTSGRTVDNNFIERSITYDTEGNINSLSRVYGGTLIDSLAYSYLNGTTNQLQTVYDKTSNNSGMPAVYTNYTYDGNGNVLTGTNTSNTGQNKSYTYNLLNLPQAVAVPAGTVTYTYDAAGDKLRKVSTGANNKTDYISGIQYDGVTTPALSFIQTEEGKAVPNGAGYDYVYYLGDNLGNTRVTFGTKTGVAVMYQKDDYLPFGMEISRNVSSPKNEYLYNKKEFQEELTQYDYGARLYDPLLGRWATVDPLAEISRRWSVYNYVQNNPIRLIDPDGMQAQDAAANAVYVGDAGYVGGYGDAHEYKYEAGSVSTISYDDGGGNGIGGKGDGGNNHRPVAPKDHTNNKSSNLMQNKPKKLSPSELEKLEKLLNAFFKKLDLQQQGGYVVTMDGGGGSPGGSAKYISNKDHIDLSNVFDLLSPFTADDKTFTLMSSMAVDLAGNANVIKDDATKAKKFFGDDSILYIDPVLYDTITSKKIPDRRLNGKYPDSKQFLPVFKQSNGTFSSTYPPR